MLGTQEKARLDLHPTAPERLPENALFVDHWLEDEPRSKLNLPLGSGGARNHTEAG